MSIDRSDVKQITSDLRELSRHESLRRLSLGELENLREAAGVFLASSERYVRVRMEQGYSKSAIKKEISQSKKRREGGQQEMQL